MKKTLTGMMALLFIGIGIANAQSSKEIPPPALPPKNVGIKGKIVTPPPPPPIKVDKEVKMPPPPPPSPIITVKGEQADEFYKRNPNITAISRQGSLITLKMKDGTTEKYNMSNKAEKKNFTDKYGKAPIPDPPPPPPPAPKKVI